MLGHQVYKIFKLKSVEVCGTVRNIESGTEYSWLKNDTDIIEGFDVFNLKSLNKILESTGPTDVINCIGAIKQRNWKDSEMIYINSYFPHRLAEECTNREIKLLQISTDCVFSGNRGSYKEDDTPDPVDLYGFSKWMGEITTRNHLTIRTSIIGLELYSNYGLLGWFLNQKGTVEGFKNAYFSGLTTAALADVLLTLIESHDVEGLLHIYSERISKFNLLKLIKTVFNKNDVEIAPSEDVYIDRSLNSNRLEKIHIEIPSMKDMLSTLKSS